MFHLSDDLPVASTSTVSLSRSRSTKQRRRRANVNQLNLQVPLPDSPPLSDSYSTTSPASQPGGLPLTPSTSDDEFPLPPPINFNPRRAGRISPGALTALEQEIRAPSHLQPWNAAPKSTPSSKEPSSPASFLSYENDASGEDEISDSEWYNSEFSKIISLRSPIPPNFPLPASETRRDSMAISPLLSAPSSSAQPTKRVSKALPPTPLIPRRGSKKWRGSIRLPNYPPPPPPTTPPRAADRAPPRSSLPADCLYDVEQFLEEQQGLEHVSEESEEDDGLVSSPVRPETASDFSFAMYDVDYASDRLAVPSTSAFSRLSHSSSSQSLPPRISVSPLLPQDISMDEAIPQEDDCADNELEFCNTFDVDSLQFAVDLERGMMLPLSLPSTPFDVGVEAGLEEIKEEVEVSSDSEMPAVVEDDVFSSPSPSSSIKPALAPRSPTPSSFSSFSFNTSPPSSRRSRRSSKFFYSATENGLASPTSPQFASYSPFAHYPPTSPASGSSKPRIPFAHLPYPPQSPSALAALDALYSPLSPYNTDQAQFDESRVLKSKWSTSTLASIAEEHSRLDRRSSGGRKMAGGLLSPSAKLRSYFRVSGSAASPSNSSSSTSSPSSSGASPSHGGNHKRSGSVVHGLRGLLHSQSPSSSSQTASPATPSRSGSRGHGHQRNKDSGASPSSNHGHGVRRRGSVTPTVSECGSDSSAWSGSSTSSSGLRRKPIPFLLLTS